MPQIKFSRGNDQGFVYFDVEDELSYSSFLVEGTITKSELISYFNSVSTYAISGDGLANDYHHCAPIHLMKAFEMCGFDIECPELWKEEGESIEDGVY